MTINIQSQNDIHIANDSYNEMVYLSKPFPYTSISNLETMATFWGLTPPPMKQARVLELGSSFGGNIISQALYYPEAQFVGVDLSHEQIKIGNEIISSIGLTNIRLEEKNILDIDQDFGEFDYIIVHGIYSWVPDIVKDKILAICRNNLSENGIAYISYNTYPGWKTREVVRDMMLFTNKYYQNLPLAEQTFRSKTVTNLFLEAFKGSKELSKEYDHIIKALEHVEEQNDYYLAHEYLETVNDPCYLHEFVDAAETHHLHYIADTAPILSFSSCLETDHKRLVTQLAENNYVVKEQCIDYLRNTTFRRSLLCHQTQAHLVDHTEYVKTAILDRFTFIKDASFLLNDILNDAFKEALTSATFTIKDIKEAAKRHNDSLLTDERIYADILRLLIWDKIKPYLTPYPIHPFEENKSYVPEHFIRYVETLLLKQADRYISFGDMYNRNMQGINVLHLTLMQQLRTPKTSAQLEEALQSHLDEHHQTITKGNIQSLTQSLLENLSVFGYLQPME